MADEVKALKGAGGVDKILLPGENAAKSAAKKAVEGIEVPDKVCAELAALSKPFGIELKEAQRNGKGANHGERQRGGPGNAESGGL